MMPSTGSHTDDLLDEISSLVEQLTGVQEELLGVLDEKRLAMARGDLENLQRLQPVEDAIGERLRDCHERRQALLIRAAGQGVEAESLKVVSQRLGNGSPKSDRLLEKIEETRHRSRQLQLEHLTHWVIAQKSLLHVSQMLEIIATGGKMKPTYGKEEFCARGSLVDHEA